MIQLDSYYALLKLKQNKIRLDDFINQMFDPDNNPNENTVELALEDIPEKSRAHEKCHGDKWRSYGIKPRFYMINGKPATAPDEKSLREHIKKNNLNAESFLTMYKDVIYSPAQEGIKLGHTDTIEFNIISGKILTLKELESNF